MTCAHDHSYSANNKGKQTSQGARRAGAYPGFCSMKRLVVFLVPPGWDASPTSQS